MSTIKFNYTTDNFDEAVGLSKEDLHTLGDKLSDKSIEMITKQLQPGAVAEWIANNISYKELLFMAIKQMYEKTGDAVAEYDKERPSMPPEIADLMKFLNKHSEMTKTDPETGATMHAINLGSILGRTSDDKEKPKELLDILKKLMGKKKSPSSEDTSGPLTFEQLKARIKKDKEKPSEPSEETPEKDE